MGVDWSRMDHRRSLLSVVDETFRKLDTTEIGASMDAYYQTAFGLMRSAQARKKRFRSPTSPIPYAKSTVAHRSARVHCSRADWWSPESGS